MIDEKDLNHFILIRMNTARQIDDHLQDPFRIGAFRCHCLATLAAQWNQNFVPVFMFRRGTPPDLWDMYMDLIGEVLNPPGIMWMHEGDFLHGRSRRQFCRDHNNLLWQKMVEQRKRTYCLQTRMDSDDAISSEFVGALHKALDPAVEFYDFPRGYWWDYGAGRIREECRPSKPSQFLSRLTRGWTDQSVYAVPHRQVEGCLAIEGHPPMWVWVIHPNSRAQQSKGSKVERVCKSIANKATGEDPMAVLHRTTIQVEGFTYA